MFRGREVLISSMSAASVVDLPLPVGPEITTRPLSASISLRRSGCRLQARRSLTEGASSRTAMAMPRIVRNRLSRHRMPAGRQRHVGRAALEELRPGLAAEKLPARLADALCGNRLADGREVASDPRDEGSARFQVQIARTELAPFLNPVLERHGCLASRQ